MKPKLLTILFLLFSLMAFPQNEVRIQAENNVEHYEKDTIKLAIQKSRKDLMANMVVVKGGTFNMGTEKEKDESPVHRVVVKTFNISKYPVTVAQYRIFCKASGRQMPDAPSWGWIDDHPMVKVNWMDAVAYTKWLKREFGGNWRLPTEAEWEYAARGGEKRSDHMYSGSNNILEVGWGIDDSEKKTKPVGGKKPNELVLYDMSGNVWEWCLDWYSPRYYSNSGKKNPKGPNSGTYRVLRGGSYLDRASYSTVTFRSGNSPNASFDDYGFRVVLAR
jgi:formylglycine-generating enzyme required for sulfatase activity